MPAISEARNLARPGWTEEHEATVRTMAAEGAFASEIARQVTEDGFPVSRNAVLGKAMRLGVSLGRPVSVEPEPEQVGAVAPPAAPEPDPEPAAESVLALAFVPPAGRPLVELGPFTCRYAVGQDDTGRHLFCSERATRKSWCADHAAVVFVARDIAGMTLAQARASGRVRS
ncbi:GcrA family cell cycle regulator [Methylobacterium nonmethylotrophicum]|uniref:GcrA cell cycle regulator n=1 Tax=Methylobacterium nonmethylotrophicum TaxID=1141884 RepID=A0A4Z0NNN7_9HYPH|nr:GcrA family cell cycle regulator [Methylobacterium nonmethylotrophicum]TGD98074.1 hypothetical protein EU555_18175 [Methylobacterium nonmethylotrophicum]